MSKRAKQPPSFAALVQAYFAEYLTQQRALSPQTIAAYRDGFVLFLDFAEKRLGKSPAAMALADITPELIMAFLDHLERQRHNSVRSRNARLAALRSFLKFAAHRDVASLQVIERALGVPVKRFERPMFGYLSREEMLAVIGEPGELMAEPAGSCVVSVDVQHRRARIGDHRGQGRRCGARRQRRLRPSARQGTQAAQRAAVAFDRQGNAGLVARKSAVRVDVAIAAKSRMDTR